jgi:hypothetical protein
MGSTTIPPRTVAVSALALLAALALLVAPAARSDQLPALLDLGPVTIANGSATLAGTVGGVSAGSVELTVNGQQLGVDATGHFAGTVPLNGQSAVSLSLKDPLTGQTSQVTIPVSTAIGGVIPPGTISAVQQALRSLQQPAGGFTVLDGRPLTVAGRLANGADLAGLQVNGVDVMRLLKPDGSFAVQLPGTTREVTLTATDRQGTSASSTYLVQQLVSTPLGRSVSAATAVGLRIAAIKYATKGAARTHRFRMFVTVKDNLGRLVRGAKVQIRSTAPGRTVPRQLAKTSGKLGRASFLVRVRARALGKRLVMVATASTSSAKAKKTTSVRLPRAKRHRRMRHARR